MVDWSARSTPALGRDSLWIGRGVLSSRGLRLNRPCNPPTREEASGKLRSLLEAALLAGRRVLVGFDFPLGYPEGSGALLADRVPAGASHPPAARRDGLAGASGTPSGRARVWAWLGAAVEDRSDNSNNRFEVADAANRRTGLSLFWGRPAGMDRLSSLPARNQPVAGLGPNPLARWRHCEVGAGRGIKPVWQLYGGVTVGSQTLLGIPRVEELRRDPTLGRASSVWPFDTGLRRPAERWCVVMAEVWPSAFPLDRSAHPVRDAAQVLSSVRALATADRSGALPGWFSPLRAASREEAVVGEEGWILGIP